MKDRLFKNKVLFKLLLDVVMLVLLTLMYSKMAINMAFHEIGGLVLFLLFILHLIINHKWITGVTKKLFSKSLPIKTRIGYIINFLLLISFILVCISGIFISKVLFQFNSGMVWKTIHYSSAAIALILIGIHIGLHLRMITSFVKKKIKLPAPAGKVIGVICLTALVAFGVYSFNTTSFTQWLAMPFTMSTMPNTGEMPDRGEGFQGREGIAPPTDRQEQGQRPPDGMGQDHMPNNAMNGGFSISNVLFVIVQFTSIAAIFTALTFGLEILLTKKKKAVI